MRILKSEDLPVMVQIATSNWFVRENILMEFIFFLIYGFFASAKRPITTFLSLLPYIGKRLFNIRMAHEAYRYLMYRKIQKIKEKKHDRKTNI